MHCESYTPRKPSSATCVPSTPAGGVPPEVAELATCPRVPKPKANPGCTRMRHVSPAERPLPGTSRVRRAPRDPTPRDPPGYVPSVPRARDPTASDHPGALGEHATCPREVILFFSRI